MNNPTTSLPNKTPARRGSLFPMVVFGSLGWLLMRKPISQDLAYHEFVDQRSLLGIPNFNDVASNLPFVMVGASGVRHCLRDGSVSVRAPWTAFFAGVALTGAGSAYYHWRPTNETLVWDRLPMSIAFMGLFTALTGERFSRRAGSLLLGPALLAGGASVFYWSRTDDLRPYFLVQVAPLLMVPATAARIQQRYSQQPLLLGALGSYAMAKVVEAADGPIFRRTRRAVSGHTLKHFLAAAGCYMVLRWLGRRESRSG